MSVAVVGAGFSGCVLARELAEAGRTVEVFEARDHIAGNCHTERHPSGVMLHAYGPHIFHTADERVWRYVQRFGEFVPYEHRVMATAEGKVYPLPINLLTINQVFGTAMGPTEARAHLDSLASGRPAPANFEEQARSLVGDRLYELFFAGYTAKQWGLDPRDRRRRCSRGCPSASATTAPTTTIPTRRSLVRATRPSWSACSTTRASPSTSRRRSVDPIGRGRSTSSGPVRSTPGSTRPSDRSATGPSTSRSRSVAATTRVAAR